MHARNAASVFPEPVGAEISVFIPASMCGQPFSCGKVGAPKRAENQSRTTGCAQERAVEGSLDITSIVRCTKPMKKAPASRLRLRMR